MNINYDAAQSSRCKRSSYALSTLACLVFGHSMVQCFSVKHLGANQSTRVTQTLALAELVGEIAAACEKAIANPIDERHERSSILDIFFLVPEHPLGLLLRHDVARVLLARSRGTPLALSHSDPIMGSKTVTGYVSWRARATRLRGASNFWVASWLTAHTREGGA